ncbi:MAG TPA: carboxylesterase family protein, partial [Gammaproteobacteria bacterium]
ALRRLPVPRLLAAQQALLAEAPRSGLGFLPFRPVLDGATLPRLPIDAVRAGEARGVAVLAGVTADEWTLFAGLDPQLGQLDQAGLRRRLGYQFDAAETERLLELYPPLLRARGIEPTPGELLTAVTGDRWFRAPCARLLQAQAAHRDDTHAYLFDWPSRHRRLRACHALELGFLFGWRDRGFHGGGPAAERLQAALQLAWSAFARDGRPHAATLGAWPACSAGQLHWMGLGEAPGVREGGWEALAGFWAGIDDERLRRV